MIGRLTGDRPALWTPDSEAALRQCGQYAAYGADTDFLLFYEDDHGNRLSILDGVAVLHAVGNTDEMRLFLTMDPTVHEVRTDEKTAALLSKEWHCCYTHEAVMQAPADADIFPQVQAVSLKDLYSVLQEGFSNRVPPFDVWYTDVHHRFRRGLCRTVGVMDDDTLVAVAMTVAECSTAALIGAVATRPCARGKGYASACVLTLSAQLQNEGKRALLSPKNEYAHRLYTRIGFTEIGEWGSIRKPSMKG